jgi:predicted transcriptional regulator
MPAASGPRLPSDEVRDVLEARSSFFARMEEAAEALVISLPLEADIEQALKAWLKSERGIAVRILPVHVMPDVRRRFDRHSGRLFISERLSREELTEELATEVALLALSDVIRGEVEALRLSTPEAERIARFALARLAALAIIMPYEKFHQAAIAARYDIDVLRSRFRTSFAQVATRLTMLQRPDASGVPFFLMELDSSNHRLRLMGARGFPHSRFGGQCPKLNVYAAFLQPGQVLTELVKLPDGAAYLTVARSIESPAGAYGERQRRTALLLACEAIHRQDLVYGDGLPEERANTIGPACRLCERRGCLARAEPPITKPLGLDEMVTGISAFDFL